nr:hypothetical protein [Streptomyces sp. CdTB01]
MAVDPRNTSRQSPDCGGNQRSPGRAGPPRRQTGMARSPLVHEGEEVIRDIQTAVSFTRHLLLQQTASDPYCSFNDAVGTRRREGCSACL